MMFLLILLAGNTFSLYNSFEQFHFQHNRHPDQKEQIQQQFNHLTNGYNMSTYWFYMNLKLGMNLLSELILFIIISLKVSDQRYQQYYVVQLVMVVIQLLVTFQSIWPFSSHSKYGFDFENKKKSIINQCHNQENYTQLACNFSESIFYMIKCAQALIIIAFISLSGVSASSFLKSRYPGVLEDGISQIRNKTTNQVDLENENQSNVMNIDSVNIAKITDAVLSTSKRRKVQYAKEGVKYNFKKSYFKSDSFAITEASSSQAEDSHSDHDNTRLPRYIKYSNQNKKTQDERSQPTLYAGNTNSSSYQPPLFQNGKNPRLNAYNHYLDRSIDDDQLDIEENKQL